MRCFYNVDKINIFKSKGALILKQILSHGFLCDIFNVHRIRYDYRFIDIMGLNFLTINFRQIQRTFLGKESSFSRISEGQRRPSCAKRRF